MTATSASLAPSHADPSAPATERDLANAIRALAMDAVEAAKSGHPGMPMGMAEIAVALWRRHLRHNPANPHWPDRDRFVVSNGHGSMLLYALLHLTGYELSIDELKRFRQIHSKTPGHPEVGVTPGVETTTGPLGQGLANAVGMALAERLLAAHFNRDGHAIVDHRTYVTVGDGCLMEGISHEACSLAGTLGLAKLVVLYDDNGISIDGEVKNWFTDDTPQRFEAYGWNVIPNVDGHDVDAVDAAIVAREARRSPDAHLLQDDDRPRRADQSRHVGSARRRARRQGSRGDARSDRLEPSAVRDSRQRLRRLECARARRGARKRLERALRRLPRDASRSRGRVRAAHARRSAGRVRGQGLPRSFVRRRPKAETVATRKASQQAIEAFAAALPEMIGGSADLTGSVFTNWSGTKPVTRTSPGNYVNFGVREFAMTAIANGLALHGGFIPYVGTFLTFSDYARNAVRMGALMKHRVVYVYTHDSIGLGEDGPTHQSIEHAATLRLIPNLDVWRPCDTVESAIAWQAALERADGPSALLFTRQNVPFQKRDEASLAAIRRGGYVLADYADPSAERRAVIIATGSEVGIAMAARDALAADGIAVRVVSMPCTSVFDAQEAAYRADVLPAGVPRVAVEAGSTGGWHKYVGAIDDPHAAIVGLDRFGESAPGPVLFKFFGFTPDAVAAAVRRVAA